MGHAAQAVGSASRAGVHVDGPGKPQPFPQGRLFVAAAEGRSVLEHADQSVGDGLEVVGEGAGPEPEPLDPGGAPVEQQIGELTGRAGVDEGVRAVDAAVQLVEPVLAGPRRGAVRRRGRRRRPRRCAVAAPGRDSASSWLRTVATRSRASSVVCGVMKTRSAARAANANGDGDVGQDADQRLTLRGARGDRRAPDREPLPFEVDVVQLVPVDEPPRRHVADLRVVLPAVPEAAHDLDEVRRLVEEVGDRRRRPPGSPAAGPAASISRRPNWRASKPVAETRACTPARPLLT